jgi:hypothetical protein
MHVTIMGFKTSFTQKVAWTNTQWTFEPLNKKIKK